MALKIVDPKVEIRALKTLCRDTDFSSKLFSLIDESMFGYAPSLAAYRRISRTFKEKGRVPTWNTLLNDPSIKENYRSILSANKAKYCTSETETIDMFHVLENYRQMRVATHVINDFNAEVTKEGADVISIFEKMRDKINEIQSKSTEEEIFTVGEEGNAGSVIHKMLNGKSAPVIPTGIPEFDEKNGGIPYTSLFLIGAPTGVGKTSTAVNLCVNMSKAGHPSCIVSLEMAEDQMYARVMSLITGIDLNKITQKKLTEEEVLLIKTKYRAFSKKLRTINSSLSVFVPSNDVSMEEVLMRLKPFNYEVIFIDYVSLLKGLDDDSQWRKLGEITRVAKRFASANNCVVGVLVQLNETGSIKYSKTMLEHASNAWMLNMHVEDGADFGVITIDQPKARNQARFKFQLVNEFATGKLRSLKSGEAFKVPEKTKKPSKDLSTGDIDDGL